MSRSSDTTLAFLLGAVAGGVLALLFAPEKGEVTRDKIRQGTGDAYSKGKDWVSGTGKTLGDRAGEITDAAKGKVHGVTDSARHQVGAVKEAIAEGKEAYRRELGKDS